MNEEAVFVVTRLVCTDCGHEIEPDEVVEQREAIRAAVDLGTGTLTLAELGVRCLDCGSYEVRQIDVDLRDDLLRAAQNAAQRARLVVEQNPELRPRAEQALAEARAHVEAVAR